MSLFGDDDSDDDNTITISSAHRPQAQTTNSDEQQPDSAFLDDLFNSNTKNPGNSAFAQQQQHEEDSGPRHLAAFAEAKDRRRKDKEQLALERIAATNAAEADNSELKRKDREMGVFRTRGYAAARSALDGDGDDDAKHRKATTTTTTGSGNQNAVPNVDDDKADFAAFAKKHRCGQQQQQQLLHSAGSVSEQQFSGGGGGGGGLIPTVTVCYPDDDDDAETENNDNSAGEPSSSSLLRGKPGETDDEKLERLSRIMQEVKLERKQQRAMKRASPEELEAARQLFCEAQQQRLAELAALK